MYPENCPYCSVSFKGEPIAKSDQHFYGVLGGSSRTHYSRVIGIYSRELDRTVSWRCPDCGKEWSRE